MKSTKIRKDWENIDWDLVNSSQTKAEEFKQTINKFHLELSADLKHWQIKNGALQAKYENVALWTKIFTEMHFKLKSDMVDIYAEGMQQAQLVSKILGLQVLKD